MQIFPQQREATATSGYDMANLQSYGTVKQATLFASLLGGMATSSGLAASQAASQATSATTSSASASTLATSTTPSAQELMNLPLTREDISALHDELTTRGFSETEISGMWSGVSGLLANSTKMTTIGDNISNVNTTGFKSTRIDFVDLMSSTIGTASGQAQIGNGVQVGSTVTDYSQGGLEATSSSTDLAISGNGFFIAKQKSQIASNGSLISSGNATTYYTRAGDFNFDSDGYLTTTTGLVVQGWKVDQDKLDAADASGTSLSSTPITGSITDIKLDTYSSPAKATSSVTVLANLDSDSSTESTRDSTNYYYAMAKDLSAFAGGDLLPDVGDGATFG